MAFPRKLNADFCPKIRRKFESLKSANEKNLEKTKFQTGFMI